MTNDAPHRSFGTTRRAMVYGALALTTWPRLAMARQGFVIDWQGAEPVPVLAAFLEAQIRIVEALPISADAMEFFRAEVIHVDREEGTKTRARGGVFFARQVQAADNPVLLHELIHRWQWVRMGWPRDPAVVRFYDAARTSGDWPAQSYMLTNPMEFFAMCASVVLHGRAARPPLTRAAVKARMPALYDFIVAQFGARLG
ncbi:MAG: hypothetical protein V4537_01140 [Pseudomonadota bacterium]